MGLAGGGGGGDWLGGPTTTREPQLGQVVPDPLTPPHPPLLTYPICTVYYAIYILYTHVQSDFGGVKTDRIDVIAKGTVSIEKVRHFII